MSITSPDLASRLDRRRAALRVLAIVPIALLAAAPLSPSQARGHVSVGIGLGLGPWPYYAAPPAYLYPPPVYYAPPAYYVPPPPVYYAPPAPPANPAQYCREYHGDASLDASGEPFYGTACLWPDGRWHIVG